MSKTRRSARLQEASTADFEDSGDPEQPEIDAIEPSSEPDSPLPEHAPERTEKIILRIKRKVEKEAKAAADAGLLSGWSSDDEDHSPDELDADTDDQVGSVSAKRARSQSVAMSGAS
jgi:hypothetical protein